MTTSSMLETDGLRERYPDVFNRPASARLAWPAMLLATLAVFVFGLVASRLLAGPDVAWPQSAWAGSR